ncbi:polyketide synthase [Aspergillus eucalypticola CBS 122712]|uniref:Polyketide synthase n=1 Tax=Aspergillus eucalypticola (strain CBS 122712 / IBT 29274) TaxID=1448314 RepID=A0A317VBN1_ASPEC|nr:polyketide synthase [Aspergillus eucalypticola CBS 122712]PWY70789.1 polyketide synthase [Aspergillus eucalypticola CBS 122712]
MASSEWIHQLTWLPAALSKEPLQIGKVVFVVTDRNNEKLSAYQAQLAHEGYATVVTCDTTNISPSLTPDSIVVHIPPAAENKSSVYEAATQACTALVQIAQQLYRCSVSTNAKTVKLFSVISKDFDTGDLGYAPLHGLARVLKMEIPHIFGGLFEDDVGLFPLSAVKYAQGFDVVRVCRGEAQTACLQPFPDEINHQRGLYLDSHSTYLITGGTGGVGLAIATWMARRGAKHIILVSRRGLKPIGGRNIAEATGQEPISPIAGLEALGVSVYVLAVDLSKPNASSILSQAINNLSSPPIKGVVHAAGTAGYHTLASCTSSDIADVLAPKIIGGLTLDTLFAPGTLDFFVFTSSIGQLVGFPGQLSYASANAFLDALAAYRRRQGDNSTSILWTGWRGVGLWDQSKTAMRMLNKALQARGITDITPDEALAAWDKIASFKTDHAVVVRALELDADEPLRHPILKEITPRKRVKQTASLEYKAYPGHAVAVIGMACRTAAGDTEDDLWEAIQAGKSMVCEIDEKRFPNGVPNGKTWGCFMSDIESFDHQFFQRSKRDATASDPHQRVLLETTYHALESAGCFGPGQQTSEAHGPNSHRTGCFIGMGSPDHILHQACHPLSPYAALGLMRSLMAGRLSHYFGWTGPSQTIDTACSSAMVAIHQACRAIQTGECTRAVAGGINLLLNMVSYDALRTGGFISPSGGCKTFDALADGYCRGEAVGVVILKPLARAIQDEDNIHGMALYREALDRAGVNPEDVSYVEAHGTGTRAGDPVEVQGIREVFGGKDRHSILHVGAVKANVGHTEGASGVISLIKVLLMMKHGKIPGQVQLRELNPKIPALEPDRMAIPTSMMEWRDNLRLAVVNNYGASGSNATAVVAPPPQRSSLLPTIPSASTWPIFISASSRASLLEYCDVLSSRIAQESSTLELLPRLAFSLATKQNRHLRHVFCTTATSLSNFQAQLSDPGKYIVTSSEPKPIVLLFSGQNGDTVPSAGQLYDSSLLFRMHLHRCEDVMQSLGLPSLYPAVLQGIQSGADLVLRHSSMFAIQYSCGMSWVDSGVKPQAICGHSFGEWAALTVSGAMTLEAAIKLVAGYVFLASSRQPECARRAAIIKKLWGDDVGSMIAIEADLGKTNTTPGEHLEPFHDTHPEAKLEIACYNGPSNYVVAGRTQQIDLLESHLIERKASGENLRFKVLRGMHAYHSSMADSIVDESAKLSASIPFQEPKLPFESCHEESWTGPGSNVIARNTRQPVYFDQAMGRIVKRLGACTFLEAGINGPIVTMARNALPRTSDEASHTFVAISGKDSVRSVGEATATLWKTGQTNVQYWLFHHSQRTSYVPMSLPPYRFAKHKHWMEYTGLANGGNQRTPGHVPERPAVCLHCRKETTDIPCIRQDDIQGRYPNKSSFTIDTHSRRYQDLVKGHIVLGTPLCPAAAYLEFAAHAVALLLNTQVTPSIVVEVIKFKEPLSMDLDRSVKLMLTSKGDHKWEFEFSSTKSERETLHATGSISLSHGSSGSIETEARDKWARIKNLLEEDPDVDALRGTMIYKVYGDMIKHAAAYRGLRHLAVKGTEGAGDVAVPMNDINAMGKTPNDNIVDSFVMNNFLEVPGAFVASLHIFGQVDSKRKAFICTGMGAVGPLNKLPHSGTYKVYTQIVRESCNNTVLDVFAFDTQTMELILSAKEITFSKVSRGPLAKVLVGANTSTTASDPATQSQDAESFVSETASDSTPATDLSNANGAQEDSPDAFHGIQEILSRTLDLPVGEITKQASLEELGVDSLISSEILASIHHNLHINVSVEDFATATDVAALCDLISSQVGGGIADTSDQGDEARGPEAVCEIPNQTSTDCQKTLLDLLGHSLDVPVTEIQMDSQLEELGADSLVAAEIVSSINKAFDLAITSADFSSMTDVRSLCELISRAQAHLPKTPAVVHLSNVSECAGSESAAYIPLTLNGHTTTITGDKKCASTAGDTESIHTAFQRVRRGFDAHAKDVSFTGYWDQVYPQELSCVTAFIVEAFEKLGCPLRLFSHGEKLPALNGTLPKYHREISRLWEILEEAGVAEKGRDFYLRGPVPLDEHTKGKSAKKLSTQLITSFPDYESTHALPDLLGPHLAECITGKADPTSILFASDKGSRLLEDFYTNGPSLRAATYVLCDFLSAVMASRPPDKEPFRVLEIGAGFGGTTKFLLPLLEGSGRPFSYTFTDISVSLLARARTKYQNIEGMEFRKLNVEEDPPAELLGRYDIVVSSNCVHAVRSLRHSLANIRKLVSPNNGCVALIESTQKLAWFELVWGLLDGWWLFGDGRTYALQSPWAWEHAMQDAGFAHVDWSEGASRESRTVRVICGMTTAPETKCPAEATSLLLHRRFSAPGERNLFLIPDGIGSGAVFGALGPYLSSVKGVSVYALNSPFRHSKPSIDELLTIEELAAIYVAEIKRQQPESPYLLGGYSVGGVLAFEVARQLLEDGNEIEKLFFIDTACPTFVRDFPDALVNFLDSIEPVFVEKGRESRATRRGQLLASDQFLLARRQIRRYRVCKLPGRKMPQVVLFAAKEGVDKQNQVSRPSVSLEDQRAVSWFLDDRTDEGWFGWDAVLDDVKMVRVDGNHFSMMSPPMISGWGAELARMLDN